MAKLPKHRFQLNPRGVPSGAADDNAEVYGGRWDITGTNEPALDKYEGVAQALYFRFRGYTDGCWCPFRVDPMASNDEHGSPREGYLDIPEFLPAIRMIGSGINKMSVATVRHRPESQT
jgi:hypothetical protein